MHALTYISNINPKSANHNTLLPCFIEILIFNANSVDPDQMPHSVASDLGLNCLLMPFFVDIRHKWVKPTSVKKFQTCIH